MIRSTAEPIFAEYIGKYKIESIKFKNLTLGNLPPTIHGEFRLLKYIYIYIQI